MIDNKAIYEEATTDGQPYGKIASLEVSRFKDTAAHLCRESESLLDVGCFCGEWLNYVTSKHKWIITHLGIDVAQNKIDEGKRLFPHLNLQCSYAEQLNSSAARFDIVTCLEVLEHIPDWQRVFESLFKLAKRQVIITVPYRESIIQTPCVHCGKLTPLYGHLRSYSEDNFPEVPGWKRSITKLRDKRDTMLLKRIYRLIKPSYPWILIEYRKIEM
jgi:ubiquinone/menaquinone biosynthesis C-methylase UbiE